MDLFRFRSRRIIARTSALFCVCLVCTYVAYVPWPRCSVISLNNGASFRPIQFDAISIAIQIRYLDGIDNCRAYWRKLSAFGIQSLTWSEMNANILPDVKGNERSVSCFLFLLAYFCLIAFLALSLSRVPQFRLSNIKEKYNCLTMNSPKHCKNIINRKPSVPSISWVTRSLIPRVLSNFPAKVFDGKRWLLRMI
jgi:hypothetical protein